MKSSYYIYKLLFLILIISSHNSIAQNIRQAEYNTLDTIRFVIHYQKTFQRDSTNPEDIRKEPMVLLIGDSLSSFTSFNSIRSQWELRDIRTGEEMVNHLQNRPYNVRVHYTILKNVPSGTLTYSQSILYDSFEYQEELHDYHWEIHDAKKKLLNYHLQKATTNYGGRQWTAWFTPQVPLSEGPYKFGGLPGLIVEMYDNQGHYSFELQQMESHNPYVNNIQKRVNINSIQTDLKGFIIARQNFWNDFLNTVGEVNLSADQHANQVASERARRNNNFIELKAE